MSFNYQDEQSPYPMEMMADMPYAPGEEPVYLSPDDFSQSQFNAAGKALEGSDELNSRGGFDENLALRLDDNVLVSLAGTLLEDVENQKRMRQEWADSLAVGIKYMGRKIELPDDNEESTIWKCTAYDTTLSTATYRTYSMYVRELFPPDGPCKSEIIGTPTKEIEEKAERRKMFANFALTVEDKGYYADSRAMTLEVISKGCAIRKVFQDPFTKKPRARYIKPENFICDLNCTSLLDSPSLGYVDKINRREITQLMDLGEYKQFQLSSPSDSSATLSPIEQMSNEEEGIQLNQLENKNVFERHERHVYLTKSDLKGVDQYADGDDKPYPYIVVIVDRKVVALHRNWEEEDAFHTREEHFVYYEFLPGFGLYGVGMIGLVGSNAITLTSILRQMVNKCALNTFPGGLKTTTLRSEDNNRSPRMGEWEEVDTGGLPINDCFAPMPYPPPDGIFFQIYQALQQETLQGLGVAELSIPENSAQTPVGTTLSALEVSNRMQSASLSSFHTSLHHEFELLFKLWAKALPNEPYPFKVPGYEGAILKEDFQDNINTVPVSDPNILTTTHRLIHAQALATLAQQMPDIFDMRAIYKRMLEAMDVENIDEILPPVPEPQSLDAVSENMLLMQGQPIQVSEYQNHPAHNTVHNIFLQQIQSDPVMQQLNPQAMFILTQHIQKHSAMDLVMQAKSQDPYAFLEIGEDGQPVEKTADDYLKDMEIQNAITAMNAEEGERQMKAMQEQAAAQAEAAQLPQKVMMEDIEQRREASELNAQVEMMKVEFNKQIAELKAEVETFKAQQRFESDTMKIEADLDIAEMKHEESITKDEMKHIQTVNAGAKHETHRID